MILQYGVNRKEAKRKKKDLVARVTLTKPMAELKMKFIKKFSQIKIMFGKPSVADVTESLREASKSFRSWKWDIKPMGMASLPSSHRRMRWTEPSFLMFSKARETNSAFVSRNGQGRRGLAIFPGIHLVAYSGRHTITHVEEVSLRGDCFKVWLSTRSRRSDIVKDTGGQGVDQGELSRMTSHKF